MKKNIKNSWKYWLIALALLILIPITVSLGLTIVSPKIDHIAYRTAEKDFMKGYTSHGTDEEAEQWKNQYLKWTKTEIFLNHERKVCINQFIELIIHNTISIILFYIGATFSISVIAASLIFSGLILHIIAGGPCPIIFGLNVKIIEMLFAFIGLIILLWAARRYSRN